MSLGKKHDFRENGSATIEAMLSFTAFLFVIFTILNVVNFCRAQVLISNALDVAAKELSQYSYFYKMSGLQKFSDSVEKNADAGRANLNRVIGSVDNLYKGMHTAANNTAASVTEVENSLASNQLDLEQVKNALGSLSNDASAIERGFQSVETQFSNIANDPMLYVRSIVAVAGSEGLEYAKSRALAAPLGKLLFLKHFQQDGEDADTTLRRLGVVDGLDGMNFKASTIFSRDDPEDVHVVVVYRLKIMQIFKWLELEAAVRKDAVTRAWLGGDDVAVKVNPQPLEKTVPSEEETPPSTLSLSGDETPPVTEPPEKEHQESENSAQSGLVAVTIPNGLENEEDKNQAEKETPAEADETQNEKDVQVPEKLGYYYDRENVILYLATYGHLPVNYFTKDEARELGWKGGSVEAHLPDAAIGGDIYENREKNPALQMKEGRIYYECDLDTHGQSSRSTHRLVYSNDGLFYVTDDHYETFVQYIVTEDGKVVPA